MGPVNQMRGGPERPLDLGLGDPQERTPAETTAKANRVPIEVSSPAILIGMTPRRSSRSPR